MSPERSRRVEELFHLALGLAAEERRQRLEEACSGDAELLAEVESLLEAHDEAGGFLEEPPRRIAEAEDDDAHQYIGHYRLIRTLGEGETSTVYLAVRSDPEYRKLVAIKVLKRGMDSDRILHRFQRERQILAALDHPNIAQLLDGGRTEDGRPYFVMEYVNGDRIDVYCDRHRLSLEDRIELYRTVCSAVHYAHRNLVVHRDLKPGNILVSPRGEPKLLDFGIAKLLDAELSPELTATVGRLMTPYYASPEQVRGEPVTTASDVYSLGVLLYELLSGRRPYELQDITLSEAERVICETQPDLPSVASRADDDRLEAADRRRVDRRARRLSGDLDTIVMTALRKEPERRSGSIQELSEDLRRYLESLPISARSDTFGYRAAKFIRRNLPAVTAAGVVAASLVAGIVLTTWQMRRAQSAQARAETQQLRAEQVSEFLIELFQVSDPSEAKGETVTAREILDRGSDKIADELEGQPEVQATLMHTMGVVYKSLGMYGRARELIEEGLEIREESFGSGHPDVAASIDFLADVLRLQGEYEEAERLLRETLDGHRELLGDEHPQVLKNVEQLGLVLSDQGRYEEAEQHFRKALAARRSSADVPDSDLVASISNLGILLQRRGRYEEAERLHRDALEMTLEIHGRNHPDVPININNLTTTLLHQGKYAEAEQYLREALALRRRLLGDDHPDVAASLSNLAGALYHQGNLEDAEQLQREALAIQQQALGTDHPHVANSLTNLAIFVGDRGDKRESERLNREALEVARRAFDGPHQLVGRCLINLASAVEALGDHRQAERLFRESAEVLRETVGDDHVLVATALNNVANSLYRQQRYEEAVSIHRDSLASFRRAVGDRHPYTVLSLVNMAGVLERLDRLAEAEEAYREALSIRREVLPANHLSLADSLVALGSLLIERGDGVRAEPLLREAVDIRCASLPGGDWRIADAQSVLGGSLTAQGRYAEAEPLLLDSYSSLESLGSERPAETRGAVRRLIELYESWDRLGQAEQYRTLLARSVAQSAAP